MFVLFNTLMRFASVSFPTLIAETDAEVAETEAEVVNVPSPSSFTLSAASLTVAFAISLFAVLSSCSPIEAAQIALALHDNVIVEKSKSI